MKHFSYVVAIAFLCIAHQVTIAQTVQEYEQLKVSMWDDPDFKSTEVPEKWNNESAVILAKSYLYEVKKEVFLNYIYENIYLHKRIKLLDKAAINEFSEYSFQDDYKNSDYWTSTENMDVNVGIKVIKPSGEENIIDINSAVVKEIKEGINKRQYKKIAIPNLEVGDILDYFYVSKNTYVQQQIKFLNPVLYPLVEEYPIVNQTFNVHTLRQIYFNSKSINGAPQLKQVDKDELTTYSLTDNDREKADIGLWEYPYRIYPTIKFQAFYIKDMALGYLGFMPFFLKEKKMNNSTVDLNHIDELVRGIYNTSGIYNAYTVKETNKYLKSNFDKKTPTDTIVKYAFYYLRKNAHYDGHNETILNLSKVLENRDIKHNIVLTIPNYISDISDLILPVEVNYLIKVKSNPDYFIGDFSSNAIFKSISKEYQGNNAFEVNNPNLVSSIQFKKIVIPTDSISDNYEIATIHANFSKTNFDTLLVTIDKSITGETRNGDLSLVVTNAEYAKEVNNVFQKKKSTTKTKTASELKAEKDYRTEYEQQQKDCIESLRKKYRDEFNENDDFKIDSFKLKQIGLWDYDPELKYSISFKLGNITKSIGQNYMISVGRLIMEQLELTKKDIDRKTDIYSPYPRQYDFNVILEIPSGYTVKGLEKLNVNITNETGGFISEARLENNHLIVNVKKYYLHNFEKVTEWPKMVEFIEGAYNFTQQNILLEKIN
jgi:hypothetical protein